MMSIVGAILRVSLAMSMMHLSIIHTIGERVAERRQLNQDQPQSENADTFLRPLRSLAMWTAPETPETLAKFFLNDYPQGMYLMPDSDAYKLTWERTGSFSIPAYESRDNGIKVAANPLVLCAVSKTRWATECVVLFHYTSGIGFVNIMSPYISHAELWAALRKESASEPFKGCQWGEGTYCTCHEPSHFKTKQEVLQNNYGNKAIDDPSWNETFKKRDGMADFAIAVIVHRSMAYDTRTQVTPEMEGILQPGLTSKNETMRDGRDVWVVQAKQEGITTNVRANISQQLSDQVDQLRSHQDEKGLAQALTGLGQLLQAQGKLQEAEPLYREALAGRKAKLGDRHPSTLESINNLADLLQDQGKLQEAEPLYREAVDGARGKLGANHPHTKIFEKNLADLRRILEA